MIPAWDDKDKLRAVKSRDNRKKSFFLKKKKKCTINTQEI